MVGFTILPLLLSFFLQDIYLKMYPDSRRVSIVMVVGMVWRGRRGRGRVGGAVLELRGRGHVALQGRAILRHVRVVAPEEN